MREKEREAREIKEGQETSFYSGLGWLPGNQVSMMQEMPGYSQVTVGVESSQNPRGLRCGHT